MFKKKILIVNDLHPKLMNLLEKENFELDYSPEISKEEVYDIIPNYHGLIVRSKLKIDKSLIDRAVNLEFIGRAGAGIDNIEPEVIEGSNVVIFNAPEGNRDAVGEHAIGLLLNLFNRLTFAHQEVTNFIWQREANRGLELKGKTVGIIGFGNTGQALAKKLSAFDCTVLAYDKYHSDIQSEYAENVDITELYNRVDVLSLHVPLTQETEFFVDCDMLERFKKPIFILNTSRGKVLNLEDLLIQISAGRVLGAGLDVLENEKLSSFSESEERVFRKLIETGKVIFTPHVAGWTFESYEKISEVLANKIIHHYESLGKVV